MIVNEMLTFISNKVDTLPETGIIQICLSAYNFEEIESARSIACKLLAPSKKFMRRKEGSEQKSVQEIIKLIKEFNPDSLPTFVAKNLNKIPPVSFDYIDITTFLKEMTILKNDVACIKAKPCMDTASSSDLDLKREIDDVKKMITELREARSTSDGQCKDLFLRPYHGDKDKRNNTVKESIFSPRAGMNETHAGAAEAELHNVNKSRGSGARGGANALPLALSVSLARPERAHALAPPSPATQRDRSNDLPPSIPTYRDITRINNLQTSDEDGFTPVTRKKPPMYRYRNARGTLQNSTKLQAAESYAYVYLSRTQKCITEENIKDHIKELNEQCLTVEKLQQNRDTNFNSFKIQVLASKINTFLQKDFWPEGLVFRRYRQQRSLGNNNASSKQV